MTKICYVVFDLTDPHVHRRITMLQAAGASVDLVGFRRSASVVPAGLTTIDLGTTENGALGKRILSVARAILTGSRYRAMLLDSDVVIARNLETLLIAVIGLRAGRRRPRLIYESLDVHRSLSGRGLVHRAMRVLERALIKRCDLLVTSSPRFITEHFERSAPLPIPHLVVENKIFAPSSVIERRVTGDEPPWIIGWFGILRCRRSLAMLTEIVRRSAGRIEVRLAGRRSYNEMPDFDAIVAATPGMSYLGGYASDALPRLYGQVHFAWCIDYMEEGRNSAWLLPNRIYEASAYGAVPIALAAVETGAWLARHGAGVRIADPVTDVSARLATLSSADYRAMLADVRAIPRAALMATAADGADFLSRCLDDTAKTSVAEPAMLHRSRHL